MIYWAAMILVQYYKPGPEAVNTAYTKFGYTSCPFLQAILSVRVQEATSYMFSLMYSIVPPMTKSSAFPVTDVLIFQVSDTSVESECLFKTRYSGYFFFLFRRTNSSYMEVLCTLNTLFLFRWNLLIQVSHL